MFYLRPPSVDEVQAFVSQQRNSTFSYSEIGASAGQIPHGYTVDRNRILLGSGEATWKRAVKAVGEWQMFNIPWIRLFWPYSPIAVGVDVAILINHLGFCSLNASRIVYVVDEDGPVAKYGFAYGTLLEHAESGEERFTVEWNRSEDQVWYNIVAFSKPNKRLAKVGLPFARTSRKDLAKPQRPLCARQPVQGDRVRSAALATSVTPPATRRKLR